MECSREPAAILLLSLMSLFDVKYPNVCRVYCISSDVRLHSTVGILLRKLDLHSLHFFITLSLSITVDC